MYGVGHEAANHGAVEGREVVNGRATLIDIAGFQVGSQGKEGVGITVVKGMSRHVDKFVTELKGIVFESAVDESVDGGKVVTDEGIERCVGAALNEVDGVGGYVESVTAAGEEARVEFKFFHRRARRKGWLLFLRGERFCKNIEFRRKRRVWG